MSEEENPAAETAPAPTWFIDEGVPGVGERPPWLSDKFKTAADLGKSYQELEKKFGTVPEDYDISRSKFLDGDYQPFQELATLAKDKRVPKEVMDKMIDAVDKYMGEFTIDQEEEYKKLGDNAQERVKVLDNWAKVNLTEGSYTALTSNLKSADAIKALEELRGKMMSNTVVVPNGNGDGINNEASVEDLQTELNTNLQKYKDDPKYRADLQRRLEIAAKTSSYVDKSGK